MLRLIYRFLWWMADTVGPENGSNIQYGLYRKFRKPKDVPAAELSTEIKRLGDAILAAD